MFNWLFGFDLCGDGEAMSTSAAQLEVVSGMKITDMIEFVEAGLCELRRKNAMQEGSYCDYVDSNNRFIIIKKWLELRKKEAD